MDGTHLLASAAPVLRDLDAAELDLLLARATGCVVFGRGATLGVDVVADGRVTRVPLSGPSAAYRLRAAAARHGVPLTPSLGRLLSRAFGCSLPDVLDTPASADESRS